MITKEDILRASNKGLDIIRHLYPDVERLISDGNMKKPFRYGPGDKNPSMHLKETDSCWIVTDFGRDQHPRNPIDCWIEEKSGGTMGFYEAIVDINTTLGLGVGDIRRDVNKPFYEKGVEASADMKEGEWYYELNEKFTKEELAVMGPLVKQEHVDRLHWYSVKWLAKCKDRKLNKFCSTDTYPIFMRECHHMVEGRDVKFFKVYRPLEPDKQYRFMYIGGRPRGFINGLSELKGEHFALNETSRYEWESNPLNEGKPYKERKLPQAVICSGERDALCARSLGYIPLWLNSETADLEEDQYRDVMKLVETLYNIPDKDDTGIRRGREMALRYPDIRTIWLPRRFERFRDNRGRSRKDFKDWLELQDHPYAAMNALISQALPARFWEARESKKGDRQYTISSVCLQNFLRMQGFGKLKDRESGQTDFVRITGNVVEKITAQDVSDFLISWARGDEKKIPGRELPSDVQCEEVQNLIIDSPRTSPAALDKISAVELDFTNYTPRSQMFFFANATVNVSSEGIEAFDTGHAMETGRYVWQENVVPHKFRLLEPMFKVVREADDAGRPVFDIEVTDTRSKVLCYLINSSRLFWREELEQSQAGGESRESYREKHRFDINGPLLTAHQRLEQRQCLMNKLFAIGYMLHAYKDPSRTWAPMAMDWRIGDDGECNGRSGKSFLFTQVLSLVLKTVKLSGRNRKLLDNPHVFDQVTRHTRMLLVDDCHRLTPMEQFYDNITSDMTVNPKNNQSYNIPYAESPKLVFTTNYVPQNFDASTDARLLYMVFSDYYHQKTEENEAQYEGSMSIRDDFSKPLFGVDYSDDEWNADLNLLLQCEQFYLQTLPWNVKLQPPMENIMLRKRKQDMSGNFEDWAEQYFSPMGTHLDAFVEKQEALDDFRRATGLKDMTMNGFTKKLRAFARYCPYILELNPADLCSSSNPGRILRRKRDAMGIPSGQPTDFIYLRTDKQVLLPLIRDMKAQEERQDEVAANDNLVPAAETDEATGGAAF